MLRGSFHLSGSYSIPGFCQAVHSHAQAASPPMLFHALGRRLSLPTPSPKASAKLSTHTPRLSDYFTPGLLFYPRLMSQGSHPSHALAPLPGNCTLPDPLTLPRPCPVPYSCPSQAHVKLSPPTPRLLPLFPSQAPAFSHVPTPSLSQVPAHPRLSYPPRRMSPPRSPPRILPSAMLMSRRLLPHHRLLHPPSQVHVTSRAPVPLSPFTLPDSCPLPGSCIPRLCGNRV